MRQKRRVSLSVIAALGLLSPFQLMAFGLGDIELHSALNEPFRAEINVSSLRDTEKGNLQVRLAPTSDFERAGIERNFLLTQLRFEVVEQGTNAVVRISSDVPVKEPFLDFLISASAGDGRMIREYTVLLDPPSEVYQPRDTPRPETDSRQVSQSRSQPASSTSTNRTTATTSYQVRPRDTLWEIALQTKPEATISVQQMMMALLESNPNAFQARNINGLQAGVTLQIPNANAIRRLSQSQAITAVDDQTTQWKNRNQPAQTAQNRTPDEPDTDETLSVDEPDADVDQPQTTTDAEMEASESIAASTAESNEPSVAASTSESDEPSVEPAETDSRLPADSRLQLVNEVEEEGEQEADPSQMGDAELKRLTQQLTLAEETIEAQTQENIEFKERMDAMEQQLETMRRLISLKDADMARLQSLLEDNQSEASNDEMIALMDGEESVEDSAEIDTNPEVLATQADNPSGAVATEPAQETTRPVPLMERISSLLSKFAVEILLGALIILLLLWLIIRQRNQDENWEESQEESDTFQTNNEMEDAISNEMIAPEVTELDDNPKPPEKTPDELVEQANMFMGYADYVQARTALDQAYQMQPDDKLIASKLLYVLYKQNKSADFLNVVQQSNFDTNDSEWSDIAEWGHELLPDHALFLTSLSPDDEQQDLSVSATENKPTPSTVESYTLNTTEAADTSEDLISEQDTHIEFNLDDFAKDDQPKPTSTVKSETDSATEDDDLLNFDVHNGLNENVKAEEIETLDLNFPEEQTVADDDWRIDIDTPALNEDDTDNTEESELVFPGQHQTADTAEAERLAMNELDLGNDDQTDLDFDLSGFDEIDEAETKLDLAAAYLDMGDPDGARGILEEVMTEGSEEQKQRAQSLLDTLA